MKVSVLTPSYNDANSITKTLDSLFEQTYTDWESIIIDDGSSDNTREVIENYKKEKDAQNKITYIYQENKDQLNALLNGMNYITGGYVFLLHSDDLLPSKEFFEKAVDFMNDNKDCDAIIGDLVVIDKDDNPTGCYHSSKYIKDEATPAKLILTKGANIYNDFSFQRKEVFTSQVKNNYVIWNTPFWVDLNNEAEMLNIKNVDFPILKYRVYDGNYANNEIGKFNLLNGELRTLTRVMSFYNVKFFNVQNFVYRILTLPIVRKLKIYENYKVKYSKEETKDKYSIIKKSIKRRFGEQYKNNVFLTSLLEFYREKKQREISLENIKQQTIYKGKDIRIFAKKLYNNELDEFYLNFMKEMKKGFSSILVVDEEEKNMAIDLLKFMCIYPYVHVRIKGEINEN